jgi:hypothetical protein
MGDLAPTLAPSLMRSPRLYSHPEPPRRRVSTTMHTACTLQRTACTLHVHCMCTGAAGEPIAFLDPSPSPSPSPIPYPYPYPYP